MADTQPSTSPWLTLRRYVDALALSVQVGPDCGYNDIYGVVTLPTNGGEEVNRLADTMTSKFWVWTRLIDNGYSRSRQLSCRTCLIGSRNKVGSRMIDNGGCKYHSFLVTSARDVVPFPVWLCPVSLSTLLLNWLSHIPKGLSSKVSGWKIFTKRHAPVS